MKYKEFKKSSIEFKRAKYVEVYDFHTGMDFPFDTPETAFHDSEVMDWSWCGNILSVGIR